MILNSENLTVWQADSIELEESHCPLCRDPLLARRGDVVAWHWYHHATPGSRRRCPWEESAWHLQWKSAYLSLGGWRVEVPVTIDGARYVIDAARGDHLREFVHSLSPYYASKHRALSRAGYDVLWIFDGEEFGSKRQQSVPGHSGAGKRHLLKPLAFRLWREIGGLVHLEGRLWRHWTGNVWYPIHGVRSDEMLRRFAGAATAGSLH
jgi:hypothetical protein